MRNCSSERQKKRAYEKKELCIFARKRERELPIERVERTKEEVPTLFLRPARITKRAENCCCRRLKLPGKCCCCHRHAVPAAAL